MGFWRDLLGGTHGKCEGDCTCDPIVIPQGKATEDFIALLTDKSRRSELRAMAGLPPDGKVWCEECDGFYLPHEH